MMKGTKLIKKLNQLTWVPSNMVKVINWVNDFRIVGGFNAPGKFFSRN